MSIHAFDRVSVINLILEDDCDFDLRVPAFGRAWEALLSDPSWALSYGGYRALGDVPEASEHWVRVLSSAPDQISAGQSDSRYTSAASWAAPVMPLAFSANAQAASFDECCERVNVPPRPGCNGAGVAAGISHEVLSRELRSPSTTAQVSIVYCVIAVEAICLMRARS
jgi:hypothetical protein